MDVEVAAAVVVEVDVIPVVSQDIWQETVLQAVVVVVVTPGLAVAVVIDPVVVVIGPAVGVVAATIVENRGTLLENALPILDTSTDRIKLILSKKKTIHDDDLSKYIGY